MSHEAQNNWFADVETIIAEPLNFKSRLAIGEDAYTSLRVKNAAFQAWEVAGVATTAAVVAKSSVVASAFFAPTGLLAAIGLGTAVTPVGWVIAASLVSGGAWVGITRYLKKASDKRVTVIPKFINTPLDVLALSLFDLFVPLALKVTEVEGSIDQTKRELIRTYFVKQWGYHPDFVSEGIKYTESRLDGFSIQRLAQTLAVYTANNRDCNFKMMSRDILDFLRQIVAVDGRVGGPEEMEIEKIEVIFKAANGYSLKRNIRGWWGYAKKTASRIISRS